ncbi:hypothetical protein VTI74DRAFT_76 [Chaetomium olivicolor]
MVMRASAKQRIHCLESEEENRDAWFGSQNRVQLAASFHGKKTGPQHSRLSFAQATAALFLAGLQSHSNDASRAHQPLCRLKQPTTFRRYVIDKGPIACGGKWQRSSQGPQLEKLRRLLPPGFRFSRCMRSIFRLHISCFLRRLNGGKPGSQAEYEALSKPSRLGWWLAISAKESAGNSTAGVHTA